MSCCSHSTGKKSFFTVKTMLFIKQTAESMTSQPSSGRRRGVTDDVILRGAGSEVHGVKVRHGDPEALTQQLLDRRVPQRRVERSRALMGEDDQSRFLSWKHRNRTGTGPNRSEQILHVGGGFIITVITSSNNNSLMFMIIILVVITVIIIISWFIF